VKKPKSVLVHVSSEDDTPLRQVRVGPGRSATVSMPFSYEGNLFEVHGTTHVTLEMDARGDLILRRGIVKT